MTDGHNHVKIVKQGIYMYIHSLIKNYGRENIRNILKGAAQLVEKFKSQRQSRHPIVPRKPFNIRIYEAAVQMWIIFLGSVLHYAQNI